MVKFKRFFCFLFSLFILSGTLVLFTGCSTEVEKVSKSLSTYNITATLGTDMKITGTEKINYVNDTGTDLSEIYLHLYPRAFREDALIKPYTTLTMASCFPNGISYGDIEISNVLLDGVKADFSITGSDEDILLIKFGYSLAHKNTIIIQIEFTITIPNCTHRFGYYEGSINLGNWYPIVCNFSDGKFDTTPYYATGDPFCSGVANYKVTLTYPSDYILASTGDYTTTQSGDNTTAIITALAVRDFAMNLSEDSSKLTGKIGDTTIYYYGYNSDEKLQDYLKISEKAVEYFNKTFGSYPYSTLSIVKTPFIYGGMEYPNIVFVSDAIDDEDEYLKVIVHEIAHQWWYATVGNDEVNEAWLDESLAEYSTALFFEAYPDYGISYSDLIKNAISSYSLYVDVIETIRGDVNTKMNLSIDKYQNDYEYSYMVYVKGVIMFDELRNAVGKDRLIAGLKKYYSNNKFKIATKSDFYEAFSSACHKDLENFFEGYLNGTTIITNIN